MRVVLYLLNRSNPELVRTTVENTSGRVLEAVRGLDVGAHCKATGSFKWTQAVRAVTVVLLRWAAWGRDCRQGNTVAQPVLSGGRATVASSINDLLPKKARWLYDVFGSNSNGDPDTDFLVLSNRDFKTVKGAPITVTVDKQLLAPLSVVVHIEDEEVSEAEELEKIADMIEANFQDRARKRRKRKKEDAHSVPQLTAINTKRPEKVAHAEGNPPPVPGLLCGRSKDVAKVISLLGVAKRRVSTSHSSRVSVLWGLPGVGKSTLASAIANDTEVCQAFSGGVLWACLGPECNPTCELMLLGRVVGCDSLTSIDSLSEIHSRLRQMLSDRKVLIVADDVWDVDNGACFQVGGANTHILYTTRLRAVAHALAVSPEDVYHLRPLDEKASLELLQRVAPDVVRKHKRDCVSLIHDLQGLPLALRVAGGILASEASYGWGIQGLLKELKEDASLILNSKAPTDMIDLAEETTPTVAALLRKSTDTLEKQERSCFAKLSVFAAKPATISLDVVASVWEMKDPRPTIRVLVDRGLLEPIGQERFQVHAVLMRHAATLLGE